MTARILGSEIAYASPWLEVEVKEVDLGPPRGLEQFWSIRTTYDYAAVLALTEDRRIPLVRQFRPAVEAQVLELPSGAVEPGEEPDEAIKRELLEETGCEAGELRSLGWLHVDSGRMATRQWGFFCPNARVVRDGPQGDEPLELLFVSPAELRELVLREEFRLGAHLALLGAALVRGWVTT
jgi:ADP-ribose pyrophosphatase